MAASVTTFLKSSLEASSGNADAGASKDVASQLTDALTEKHGGDDTAAFRDDSRQLGLALKKDNPALAQQLLDGSVSAQQVANMDKIEWASKDVKAEVERLNEANARNAVIVDDKQAQPDMEGEEMDNEGGLKGERATKIESLRGIDFS